jgi:hypothetical protein
VLKLDIAPTSYSSPDDAVVHNYLVMIGLPKLILDVHSRSRTTQVGTAAGAHPVLKRYSIVSSSDEMLDWRDRFCSLCMSRNDRRIELVLSLILL